MSFKIVDVVKDNFLRIADLNRDKQDEKDFCGYLNGYKDGEGNTFCTLISQSLNFSSMNMVGVYDTRRCVEEEELVEGAMNRIDKKNGQYYFLFFDTDGQVKVCLIDLKEGSYEDSELECIALDKYLSSCLSIELSGNLIFKLNYDQEKSKFKENLEAEYENLVKSLRKVQFKLENSEYKMNCSSSDTACLPELYLHLNEDELEQLKTIQGINLVCERAQAIEHTINNS